MTRIAIIGGGVAGLTAAARLAHRGADVELFEAGPRLGGSCTTTTIDGYTFADGAMYAVMPGLYRHVASAVGARHADHLDLRRITRTSHTVLDNGQRVTLDDAGLQVHDRDGATVVDIDVAPLIGTWAPILEVFEQELLPHPPSTWRLLRAAGRHLPRLRGTALAELQTHIPDRSARAALAAALLYTGVPVERLPAVSLLGLVAMLTQGFHVPASGMGAIPAMLADVARRHGAHLHVDAPVERIERTGRRATGITVDGSPQPADIVISTTTGMHTYTQLLDPDTLPAPIRRRLDQPPLSHQAVSVQLGLRRRIDAPAHVVNLLPATGGRQERLFGAAPGDWLSYTVPTVTIPELAPRGDVIETYIPLPSPPPAGPWTPPGDADVVKAVDAVLTRLHGQHDLDIAVQRVRSPSTMTEQLRLHRGALYGLSPAAPPKAQFPHRTGIPGMIHAGQTTYPGYGVATACLSGLFAADAALQRP